MKIDVELDERETGVLLLLLGAGTASLANFTLPLDSVISIINKLMKDNPNFTPYATSGEDAPNRAN
jgi:hypothetical protein